MSYGFALKNGLPLGLGNVPALASSNPFRSATLYEDFTSSTSLDPRITFSRSSNAWYFNSAGVLTQATTNTPRFDYDPSTLAPRGLLIEEQRTNLLTYSEQFDNATGWTLNGTTVTANAINSPANTITADKIVESAATSDHDVLQSFSTISGTAYTLSCYVKAAERTFVALELRVAAAWTGSVIQVVIFNLSNGTGSVFSGTPSFTIQSVGNGWYRCSITASAIATTTAQARIGLSDGVGTSYAGNGTSGAYAWGAQLEAGSFATSYIPTTTASATRAADVAVMTGSNFSSWYNQTEGTLFAEFSIPFDASVSSFPLIVSANDNTFNNTHSLYERTIDDTVRCATRSGGVAQTDMTAGSAYAYGSNGKAAMAYKVNDFGLAFNGSASASDTSGSVPTVDRFSIGSQNGGLGVLNGYLRRIAYYPRRLSNAELQGITS